jgi:hypothetical protein
MAYLRRFVATVDHTKVSTTDHINFTWPFSITHTELRSIANGGLLRSDAFDFAPFTGSDASGPLKYERTSYDPVGGTITGVVKSTTLSTSVDGVVHFCYQNSSISTDQQDRANAWAASVITAKAAFGDGSTLDLTDHSGNFNLTNTGAAAAAGLIGGAASFNGTSALMEKTAAPFTAYPAAFFALFKPSASVTVNNEVITVQQKSSASIVGVGIRARATDAVRAKAGGATDTQTANGVLNSTNWHSVFAAFGSSTTRRLIVDGAATIVGSAADGMTATLDDLSIGASFTSSVAGGFFAGLINGYLIYSAVPSDAWGLTLDAAFRGTASFYTITGPFNVTASASPIFVDRSALVRAWEPATIVPPRSLVAAFTAPLGGVIVTTQPADNVASGATLGTVVFRKTLADGVTVDSSYVGPITVSLVRPSGQSGSLGGTTVVTCVAGVATCTNLVPTADGPGYALSGSIPGGFAGVTSSFTVIGAVVAANQAFAALLAAGGGTLLSANDPRVFSDGALPPLGDVIGPIAGRATGFTMAGSGATVASGKVQLNPANAPYYESPADARLNFVGTVGTPNPLWLLVISTASSDGELASIGADPRNATAYPHARARAASGTWQAALASDGAAPSGSSTPIPRTAGACTSDSGVATGVGVVRAMAVGKLGYQSPTNDQSTQVNGVWGFLPCMGGKQPRLPRRMTPATAGSCKLAIGAGFGGVSVTGELSWVGVFSGDMTRVKKIAFHAFAKAQFNATIEIIAVSSIAFAGNSHVTSQTDQSGGDMQTPVYGSGTTSMPDYLAKKVSGPRGSLLSQGLDVAEVHSWAWGRSGKNINQIIDTFDLEIALLADGTRTGAINVLYYDIGNSIGPGVAMTQPQYLAACVTLKGKCDALAAASGLVVNLIHILDTDRGLYVNATYPTLPSGPSAEGTLRLSIGAAMLANESLYGRKVFDLAAAVPALSIGVLPTPSCYSTTNYDITANAPFAGGDTNHLAPPGYRLGGEAIKTLLFDVDDTLLYPVPFPGTAPAARMAQSASAWIDTPRPAVRVAMAGLFGAPAAPVYVPIGVQSQRAAAIARAWQEAPTPTAQRAVAAAWLAAPVAAPELSSLSGSLTTSAKLTGTVTISPD